MKKSFFSCCILFAAIFLFGCQQAGTVPDLPDLPLMKRFVSGDENGYTFAGLNWFIEKQEVVRRKEFRTSELLEREPFYFTVPVHDLDLGADGIAVYTFISEDDLRLCGGRCEFAGLAMSQAELYRMALRWAKDAMPLPDGDFKSWEFYEQYEFDEDASPLSLRWTAADGSAVALVAGTEETRDARFLSLAVSSPEPRK